MTIEELKKNQTKKSRLLGLDLGSKRIGVSICDDKQSIATPYKTINKTNIEKLIKTIKRYIKNALILIVDDSSNKKIKKIIDKKKLGVVYFNRGKKYGRGSAVIFGL